MIPIYIISSIILVTCIIYIFYIISIQNKSSINNIIKTEIPIDTSNKSTKNILYYYPMFRHADFFMGIGSELFSNCPIYKNCYIDSNKNYLPSIEDWDAILFHMPEPQRWTIPSKRNNKQRYIFYSLESPMHTYSKLNEFNSFFNWTMTYRLDSDVYRPYGLITKQKTNYKMPTIEEISQRPKKIAWFVSNCYDTSKRKELAKAINESIPVDIYGKCGTLTCKDTNSCRDMLEKNYKFYLSFENAICMDYITEKTFSMLKHNVIPVVHSGAIISQHVPEKSIINVQDFSSIKSLVEYIQYLDTHPEEYLKYFEWKKNYIVDDNLGPGLCNLCEKLNIDSSLKIYNNVDKWWNGLKKDYCSNSFIDSFLKTEK